MSIELGVNPAEAVGLVGVGMALGAATMRGYMRSLLHDEGHRVFVTPGFEALQAVIAVCDENGLKPSREIADNKVVQALMSDNRTVFLVSQPDVAKEMGDPTAAPMFRAKNPAEAARRARSTLVERGFIAEIIDPISDQTKGDILFVRTDALACGLIGFREHVVKMGAKPPRWSPGRVLGFGRADGSA